MFLKEVMRKVSFKKYIMLSVYKSIIELWRNAVSLENTRWVRVVQGIAKSYCRFLRLARCSNPKNVRKFFFTFFDLWRLCRKYKCK